LRQADKLFGKGEYEEALKLITNGLEKYPEYRYDFIKFKSNVLLRMEEYDEAVEAAIEADSLSGRNSANGALNIGRVYIQLKDIENAFKWLEISVDRGFQNHYVFDEYDVYKPLRGERLDGLKSRMIAGIGIGKPVKQFNREDLSGNEVSPKQCKGKVLLIDFWATWCLPCVMQMPMLMELYGEFKDEGFEVVSISLDSDREKLNKFIEANNLKFPIVFSGEGWKDETKESYGVKNIPASWLVDKNGVVRYFGLKGADLRNAIAGLIGE
jgi:peroxiredoxin